MSQVLSGSSQGMEGGVEVSRDYSQPGDPYGIAEYTAQSADQDTTSGKRSQGSSAVDVRGNEVLKPRGIPTQAEADAIVRASQTPAQRMYAPSVSA